MKGSVEEILRLLDEADPVALDNLIKSMNHTSKAPRTITKSEHTTCKIYTSCTKTSTCLVCGSSFTIIKPLHKGDRETCINKSGNCSSFIATGKEGDISITSYVSRCNSCINKIKLWDREKLESAFITLLNKSTFKEVVDFAESI